MSEQQLNQPVVGIVMGSDSDFPTMKEAAKALHSLGVSFEMKVLSAHRTPIEMSEYALAAEQKGLKVVIAGAGGAAHLPGMIAAHTPIPVIGVPVLHGPLQGQDALLSIVQMPKGVPVATVAIGNAFNAGILAAQIVAFGGSRQSESVAANLRQMKKEMHNTSLAKTVEYDSGSK